MKYRWIIGLLLLAALPAPVFAQDEEEDQPPAATQSDKPQNKEDKIKAYDAAVKDLVKTSGAFTLYQRKQEILVELKETDFDKLFFVQATFATGGNYMGMQAGDPIGAQDVDMFTFQKQEGAVWLIRPNLKYRWAKNDPLALSSERSFPKAILGSYKIEATQPDKGLYLVNITSLFYGGVFQLTDLVNDGGGTYQLDREKCLVRKLKSFPENAAVQMQLHFMSPKAPEPNPLLALLGMSQVSMLEDGRSLPLTISYNLWWRKDTGYMPRLMDDRVGYFTTDFFSVGKFAQQDRKERYINRFNVAKKAPSEKVSDPVKHIVWVIDSSVPQKYRSILKEGILWWNTAFEPMGFKNAVQVIDQPNDPDYDHADGRYNVIRWTISPEMENAYAIAQFRTDPLTGEVMNAAVSIDANYVTAAFEQHKTLIDYTNTADSPEKALSEQLQKHGWTHSSCTFAKGLAQSARAVWITLNAVGARISRDDFTKQLLLETVAHEVGHCLGLRHNFVASTNLTTAQLGDEACVLKNAHSASVMDYTPANVLAALKGNHSFFAPHLGVYDLWAIKWGYSDVKGTSPTDERYALGRIAAQCGQPGLAYMTDENADAWDPAVMRFDLAKDSLNFYTKQLYASRLNLRYAIEKLPKPGESYQKRTQVLMSSMLQVFATSSMALPYIGGLNANRNHRGDANERPTLKPVDAVSQDKALRMILDNCFNPKSMQLPAKVLNELSVDFDSEAGTTWTAPIRKLIALKMDSLLAQLLQADRLSRIAENEQKLSGSGTSFTLDRYLSRIMNSVFSEVASGASISPIRRDVQKYALSLYVNLAGSAADTSANDAKAICTNQLVQLRHKISVLLKNPSKMDNATRIHLTDLSATINRFMDRRISVSR